MQGMPSLNAFIDITVINQPCLTLSQNLRVETLV